MSENLQLLLKVVSGQDAGSVFSVEGTCFIGTQSTCDICLTDPDIAPMHARIGLRGGAFVLSDLTAKADIRVNKNLIKSRKITPGDIIDIAGTVMEVLDPAAINAETQVMDEDEVLLVGVEDSPKTEIVIPSPPIDREEPAAYVMSATEEIDFPEGEHYTYEEAPVYDDGSGYDESAIDRHKRRVSEAQAAAPEKRNSRPFLILGFIVLIAAIVGVVELVHTSRIKSELAVKYNAVLEFADHNGNDIPLVLAEYAKLQNQIRGKYMPLEKAVAGEIARLQLALSKQEQELKELLITLDRKAGELVAGNEHDKAVELYLSAGGGMGAKVASLRSNEVARIHAQKAKYVLEMAEQEKKAEEQKLLEARQKAEQILLALAEDVVNALLAYKNDVAVKLLEDAEKNDSYEKVKDSLALALGSVRLLDSFDKVRKTREVADGEMAKPDESELAGLSPDMRAVVYMRDGDLLAARNFLKKEDTSNPLIPALVGRLETSDGKMKLEKDAVILFTKTWKKIEGGPITVIPRPEDCIILVKKVIDEGKRTDIKDLCLELVACRKEYAETAFVKRYISLFDTVYQLYPAMMVGEDMVIDPGNGKIIQVDGSTCFVEPSIDPAKIMNGKVALFQNEATYFSAVGAREPFAVRINIQTILPYKAVSSKLLRFVLPDGMQKPAIGQSVVIAESLEEGSRIMLLKSRSEFTTDYQEDFETGIGIGWRSVSQVVINEAGRLHMKQSKKEYKQDERRKALEGDVELVHGLEKGAGTIEFDLLRESSHGFAVAIGNVSFVLGLGSYCSDGIYLRDCLIKPAELLGARYGSVEHVVINWGSGSVSIGVNNRRTGCTVSDEDIGDITDCIRFYQWGGVFIDNVKVTMSGISAGGQVVGFGQNGQEVVVSRSHSSVWRSVVTGQKIYFFRKDAAGEVQPVTSGQVRGIKDDLIICSVPQGHGLDGACIPSLEPKIAVVLAETEMADSFKLRELPERIISYGTLFKKSADSVQLQMDMPVNMPAHSYVYSMSDYLKHPQTGEMLALSPAKGGKCVMSQVRDMVTLKVADPKEYSYGVIFSTQPMLDARLVDVLGISRYSSGGGYSSLVKGKGFWDLDKDMWDIKMGRLISKVKADTLPMLISPICFPANVQYDLSINIEEEKDAPAEGFEWIKDVMLELYYPARQSGITFGLGTAKSGGIWTGGRTISLLERGTKFAEYRHLPADVEVRTEANWAPGMPALALGKEYAVRIRRVGDVVVLYLNGKRVSFIRYPGFTGDVQLRLAVPRGIVSIGRSAVKDLPRSCLAIDKEGDLGDFGYVLSVSEGKAVIDSDSNNLTEKGKVTIMAVDNVIKGEKSKTYVLKKAASGSVAAMGPRTSIVLLSSDAKEVKPGMKVLSGTQPDSIFVTEERFCDIDQGL